MFGSGALGLIELEALDDGDVFDPFVALTVKVYEVPFVSPVILCVSEVVFALVSVPPEGSEVTVYPVIAFPPLLTGAWNVTLACALPAVAVPIIGAVGAIAFAVYVRLEGLSKLPLLEGVRVITPATVGVMLNVAAVDEFENVLDIACSPVGVIVIVPV